MDFTKRFDRYSWNAALYTSQDAIYHVLREHDIWHKKISAVHPIGIAQEFRPGSDYHLLCDELKTQCSAYARLSYPDYRSNKYPQVDDTMIICSVTLEEPAVIVFEDRSTLELLPCERKGLWIAFDQIPQDMRHGANDPNFDSHQLFHHLNGQSLDGLRIWQDVQNVWGDASHYYRKSSLTYQFYCPGYIGFSLKESYGNRYKLELMNQSHFAQWHRNTPIRMPFAGYKKAVISAKQIPLSNRGNWSDGFAFAPTVWDPEEWLPHYPPEGIEDMVSLPEDDAWAYLMYFLDKHCSNDFPDWTWNDWEEHEDSEDDLHYNKVISYERMHMILADIRDAIELLKTDFDDPRLDDVKKLFDPTSFMQVNWFDNPRPEEMQLLRENVDVIVHFYERFCWCIENMMRHNPQYQYISIWGL